MLGNYIDKVSFNTSAHFDKLNEIAQCKFNLSRVNEVIYFYLKNQLVKTPSFYKNITKCKHQSF